MEGNTNRYITLQPPMPWKSYVGTAVVAGALVTPIVQLALRHIDLMGYAWRQAAALAGAGAVRIAVSACDLYDQPAFNALAYQRYRADPPTLDNRYIQYWKQAADDRLEDLPEGGTRFDQRRRRAALIRCGYFSHVERNNGYMVTLEKVFRAEAISNFIRDGGDVPLLPAL